MRSYLATLLVTSLCHAESTQSNIDLDELRAAKPASGEGLDPPSPVSDIKPTGIPLPQGEPYFATYNLCGFSCANAFCPENICEYDILTVDLNRHCNFACKYGYCPADICQPAAPNPSEDRKKKRDEKRSNNLVPSVITVPSDFNEDSVKNRDKNDKQCLIYKDGYQDPQQLAGCKKACQETLNKAKEEGRTSNYGCILWSPESEGGLKSIPWQRQPSTGRLVTGGKCSCDNWLANDLMDYFIEALPAIAQVRCVIIGCYPY